MYKTRQNLSNTKTRLAPGDRLYLHELSATEVIGVDHAGAPLCEGDYVTLLGTVCDDGWFYQDIRFRIIGGEECGKVMP